MKRYPSLYDIWTDKVILTREQRCAFKIPSPEEIFEWLELVVQNLKDTKNVKIENFKLRDNSILRAQADLYLDNKKICEVLTWFDEFGKLKIQWPMFWSPFGVPASYSQYEVAPKLEKKIEKCFYKHLPKKVKPYGLDRSTGRIIDRNTPEVVRMTHLK